MAETAEPSHALEDLAAAKINLDLLVTGRRGDGYHELDSLVVFAEIADGLSASPADSLTLEVDGPFAHALAMVDDNIVLRAAGLLREHAGITTGARIRLDKRLPVAGGIGGGSADAAAALRLLNRLWRCALPQQELARIALELGADVPVCLASTASRMRGRGERIEPLGGLPALPLVLVNPGVQLSTAGIFRDLAGRFGGERACRPWPRDLSSFASALHLGRNDLEAVAIARAPVIADVLHELAVAGEALVARMSGSGATCYGLFANDTACAAAARRLARRHPEWWIVATRAGGGRCS